MLVADEMLLETGRRAYTRAVPVLKHARRAAEAAGQSEWFATRIADLREHHRRRPTLIAMLDKAGLGSRAGVQFGVQSEENPEAPSSNKPSNLGP
jgi:hypothetical protein